MQKYSDSWHAATFLCDSDSWLVTLQTILMLDEVIHMLAAVRDAAAADTYSALPSSTSVDDASSTEISTPQQQHRPSTRHDKQQQQRRRAPLRPVSVASIDLRDPDEY